MKTNTRKVLIVEGKNDYKRIKHLYPKLQILITNGSAVSDELLEMIKQLSKDNEIIILTDPDYSGEYIRRKILTVCPNASHVFVNKQDAISKNKKKVGVEHVPLTIIKDALKDVIKSDYHSNVTLMDLYDLGLIGANNSKIKRKKLCEDFKIGYVNGKQLVNRLNLFNITLEQIKGKL